jgi:MarR family transcriptional regulator, organic hydroperoxide resistance regulator
LAAYPAIFLGCHRRHVRDDETGRQVTEHQASILDHLDPVRPLTLSKLAEHMGLGRSAMSIAVSRLESAGYILRTPSRNDARSVGLTLTPAGAKIKEQNTVLDPELVVEMFKTMRSSEVEKALSGIELVAQHARMMLRRRTRGRDS